MERCNECSEERLEKFNKESLQSGQKVIHVGKLKDTLVGYLKVIQ
jgi:hypothetical protein